ncbi:dihydrofolate reductase, partial [Eurytemora carolleeae]|uniref:dihydrofolate reductase n=1 Tax=Eurytemora carolleeae TaxID=1294199 RepID=UPI000C7855EC
KLDNYFLLSENLGIGKNGELPWRLKNELKYFANLTKTTQTPAKKNAVLMGRKTWESIPAKFRPLKDRINIVLTSQAELVKVEEGVYVCPDFPSALDLLNTKLREEIEICWVIGGSSVYQEALKSPELSRLYITRIKKDFDCDAFFPELEADWIKQSDSESNSIQQEEDGIKYEYEVYERKTE